MKQRNGLGHKYIWCMHNKVSRNQTHKKVCPGTRCCGCVDLAKPLQNSAVVKLKSTRSLVSLYAHTTAVAPLERVFLRLDVRKTADFCVDMYIN